VLTQKGLFKRRPGAVFHFLNNGNVEAKFKNGENRPIEEIKIIEKTAVTHIPWI